MQQCDFSLYSEEKLLFSTMYRSNVSNGPFSGVFIKYIVFVSKQQPRSFKPISKIMYFCIKKVKAATKFFCTCSSSV